MKKKIYRFILFSVIPFLIPFINEIDDMIISVNAKWVLIIILIVVDFTFSLKELKEEEVEQKELLIHIVVSGDRHY